MEREGNYDLVKAEKRKLLPEIDLLRVPHKGRDLTVGTFGPNAYVKNVAAMREYANISFRPATTSESISIAAYEFKESAKPKIFDSRWLQIPIMNTNGGVIANPPRDRGGNLIIDENNFDSFLGQCKKLMEFGYIKEKILDAEILVLLLMKHLNKEFKIVLLLLQEDWQEF
jgi:hypothetical protein